MGGGTLLARVVLRSRPMKSNQKVDPDRYFTILIIREIKCGWD
jgi:hypothetical protein